MLKKLEREVTKEFIRLLNQPTNQMDTITEVEEKMKVAQKKLTLAYDEADMELITELEREIDELQKQYTTLKGNEE